MESKKTTDIALSYDLEHKAQILERLKAKNHFSPRTNLQYTIGTDLVRMALLEIKHNNIKQAEKISQIIQNLIAKITKKTYR